MKAALINRYFDLRTSLDPKQCGWIVYLLDMRRIAAILQERYGYDIALNGTITI